MDTAVLPGAACDTSDTAIEIDLSKDASSVPAGRHWLTAILQSHHHGLATGRWDDAILCLSELIANAVRHAKTECRVAVTWTGDFFKIAVEDGADGHWLSPSPLPSTTEELWESGRGYGIVTSLADRWGQHFSERPGKKVVWVLFEKGQQPVEGNHVPRPRG